MLVGALSLSVTSGCALPERLESNRALQANSPGFEEIACQFKYGRTDCGKQHSGLLQICDFSIHLKFLWIDGSELSLFQFENSCSSFQFCFMY